MKLLKEYNDCIFFTSNHDARYGKWVFKKDEKDNIKILYTYKSQRIKQSDIELSWDDFIHTYKKILKTTYKITKKIKDKKIEEEILMRIALAKL